MAIDFYYLRNYLLCMRISRPLDFTFEKNLQDVYYASDMIDEGDIRLLLTKFERLSPVMNYSTPLLFVIDYTRAEYIIMTNGSQLITGHDPREFLEGGIPLLKEIYNADDFRVYNEKVFTTNIRFLKSQLQEDHHKYIFSYNFRVRHKSGQYVPIFQRGSYITSKETGQPLYSLGMITDISVFKQDRVMYHSIEKIEGNERAITKKTIMSNYFFPYEEDTLLSRHELTILELMASGLSSKQIAYKMNLSENTIANHRKNMLKKTNTKNVAELVAFACHSRII